MGILHYDITKISDPYKVLDIQQSRSLWFPPKPETKQEWKPVIKKSKPKPQEPLPKLGKYKYIGDCYTIKKGQIVELKKVVDWYYKKYKIKRKECYIEWDDGIDYGELAVPEKLGLYPHLHNRYVTLSDFKKDFVFIS